MGESTDSRAESFIGTWRLLSCELRTADGDISYPYGRDARGYITYTADGYMSVSIMSDGRRNFADGDLLGGTVEEKLAAAESYISYCGKYQVREDRVIHNIEVASFPNFVGDSQERLFQFSAGRLSLSTVPILFEGKQRTAHVVWERV
ncbi:MAG: lipocalin-like domain-containing protein [Chloroflexi bacterium]|nr:lipocalin-like domain-containing protein [Chloroflexota bacterium]